MAGTSQPHVLSSAVSAFGNFTAAHGFAVNLFAVIVLAAVGLAFVSGQRRLARIGVLAGAVFCLADWVLIEDFGFFGGLGTDPNSMIPLILLFTAGYLALTPVPQPAPAAQPVPATEPRASEPATAVDPAPPRWPRPRPSPHRSRGSQRGPSPHGCRRRCTRRP